LTEAHCGTDLGLLRTKATLNNDGTYNISGAKIFITSGEHDLAENIIHTVLARLPDAPPGIKGISLFLVPKFLVNSDHTLGQRNAVHCGSIEEKMGIKASSTCVMNFDNATGYLIGELNQGMQAMFSMMNLERLNIGIEGIGLAEVSYQNAVNYAKDRLQSRALTGIKFPEKAADPIIVHPDVRRMLLTMKAYIEGGRALSVWAAMQADMAEHHEDEKTRELCNNLIALVTPVIKAFFTDFGSEACNLGLQVLGGHGYIKEWGMEQFVRDARIAQIYEGTNGIQALDLVRRKLVMNEGMFLNQLIDVMVEYISHHQTENELAEFIQPFEDKLKDLREISQWIINAAKTDPNIIGSSSTDYLRLLGLVLLAFMWVKTVEVSLKKSAPFYQAKIKTARFYFQKLLPQIECLKQTIKAGSQVLMDLDTDTF
jgi:alkylation response protein AidB-like acyl-CoA dehydrogenase